MSDVGGAIGDERLAGDVVGSRLGIFEVKYVVFELPEAFGVLEVIPRDAAKWVLSDQTCDDDAHACLYRALRGAAMMDAPRRVLTHEWVRII